MTPTRLVDVLIVAGATTLGMVHRDRLRRWALDVLANGSPVMLNVTVEDGVVKIRDASWGYIASCTFLRGSTSVQVTL